MKISWSVKEVATIVHERGDCEMWGAEDESLEACVKLVLQAQAQGKEMIESGQGDFDSIMDLLQEELGLEPDYIMHLWG